MKRFFIIITIIFSVLFVLVVQNPPVSKDFIPMTLGNVEVVGEVLDTYDKRVQGLSGRESLLQDHVLLFVFDDEDFHGIWMKNMNFSIDIMWVNRDLEIVHIEENVSPQTYPEVFRPKEKSLYVIETVSNFIQDYGIEIGDTITF